LEQRQARGLPLKLVNLRQLGELEELKLVFLSDQESESALEQELERAQTVGRI
jgi:hypothetical protein